MAFDRLWCVTPQKVLDFAHFLGYHALVASFGNSAVCCWPHYSVGLASFVAGPLSLWVQSRLRMGMDQRGRSRSRLEQGYYTITPRLKESVERILRVTNPVQRRLKLSGWLETQEPSTKVLYSLLMLGLASERLSLDKYAIFYICEVPRSGRSTIVKSVLEYHRRLGYLSKGKGTITSSYTKRVRELKNCPTVVEREYRPNDRVSKLADLAVLYEDERMDIPGAWKFEYIEGRSFKRDTYRFAGHLTISTVTVANTLLSMTKDHDVFLKWATPARELVEERLQQMARCYGLDINYQLTIDDSTLRSSIFAGLALLDPGASKIHSFDSRASGTKQWNKSSQ